MTLTTSRGHKILLDSKDYALYGGYSWYVTKSGYAARRTSRNEGHEHVYLHKLILGAEGFETDHINGSKLDNRRANLRLCTHAQNNQNVGPKKNNTTGYRGVVLFKGVKGNRWKAQIHVGGKPEYLGMFADKKLAAEAYNEAAKRLCGEFAWLNPL